MATRWPFGFGDLDPRTVEVVVVLVGDEPLEPADRQRSLERAARAVDLARRVAGAPERADERRRVEHELEGLLVLAAADERDVAVGLDAGRAGERAWRRAGPLDDRLLGHGLGERDVGRVASDHVRVELVGHRDGAGRLALLAAGAGRLVDEPRLLRDLRAGTGRRRPARCPSTSLYVRVVTFGWWIDAAIFGVEMQLAQSRVGKTLLSRIIFPPTLASFSTSRTR